MANLESRNPNSWSCLPASVANVIGMAVEEFIDLIGHDGRTFPYGPPYHNKMRGFHTQECIKVLIDQGWAATPIEYRPSLIPAEGQAGISVDSCSEMLFHDMLACSKGFICGELHCMGHAVANFKGTIVDPRNVFANKIYTAHEMHTYNFEPLVYFRVDKCT